MSAGANRSPECPSRLRFDRWLAGELEAPQAHALEAHARGCTRCEALLGELQRGTQAFHKLCRKPSCSACASAPNARRPCSCGSLPRSPRSAASLVAWTSADEPDTVRIKGGPQLSFYVLHEGHVRPGVSGERVQAGDRVQFGYSSSSDGYLAIVSIDAANKASVFFAPNGHAAKITRAEPRGARSEHLARRHARCRDRLRARVSRALRRRATTASPGSRSGSSADAPGCTIERFELLKVP